MCLVVGSLVTVVGLSFSGVDPLGLQLDQYIEDFSPWQDYYEEPYSEPDYEEKEIPLDESSPESPAEFFQDNGMVQLVQYLSDIFTFNFIYPEGWEFDADESFEGVTFNDPVSNTTLSVSKEWLCHGCDDAAGAAGDYMDVILMQSQFDTFEVIESIPFYFPTGEDAHYGVYRWKDMEDGGDEWAYDVEVVTGDEMISFILRGDDPVYFELYEQLIDEVVNSFTWK
jgi:hypothetical protein